MLQHPQTPSERPSTKSTLINLSAEAHDPCHFLWKSLVAWTMATNHLLQSATLVRRFPTAFQSILQKKAMAFSDSRGLAAHTKMPAPATIAIDLRPTEAAVRHKDQLAALCVYS
jgi:hypothetical protein